MREFVCFSLIVAAFFAGADVCADPALIDHVFTEGFESGSVGSWSSYPPSQDTAYDPTIWVRPLLREKDVLNRALYREITPNYEIDYVFGVRKKLNMYVDDGSVLTFRCMVKSYRGTEGVRLRFGFGDGTMRETTIPFTETETWRACSVRFSDLPGISGCRKLDAVAFMAVCPDADPETVLRFGLDDVTITGKREAQWHFTGMAVHKLDEWPDFIAGEHYQEGGTAVFAGMPPFTVRSVEVTVSRALTGGDALSFSMKRERGGSWSLSIPLDAKKGVGPGFWRATINAEADGGETSDTSIVFLVEKSDAPKGHPRLFMSPGDREGILERASSGHLKEVWEYIGKNAADRRERYDPAGFRYNLDALDELYWLPTFRGYIAGLRAPEYLIRDNAVVYGVTGEREAGDAAKKALISLADWPSYVHPHIVDQGQFSYWPEGIMLSNLAFGYDMVHDAFTAEERRKVADALYSKGLTQVFNEYVRDNRVSSNTSNWIADVMGAGILLSIALSDEFDGKDLEPYLSGCLLKLGELVDCAFDSDGSYGEGVLYYSHALHCLTKSMAALDRTFGVEFPEKIATSHRFLLYQTAPATKDIYDYGDAYENWRLFSRESYLSLSNFSYLIGRYRDPRLRWLYDASPGANELDLFFLDDTVRAEQPRDLPTVALFRDVGTAVFRSGFGDDDFAFIFRCGPFVNHQHFDQGGFHLADRGEKYLGEVGRSDYYKDPWYQKLVIQPGGHNCILVDGNPESQRAGDFLYDVPAWRDYARITDFVRFVGGACLSGRLDPIYKGKLSKLRRSVLYIEPRTIVLIDEAAGADDSREVNLRFHAPVRDAISVHGRYALIGRQSETLTIRTIAPEQYLPEILKRPMTLNEFDNEDPVSIEARGFLQLTAGLDWAGESTTFVNVLTTDHDVVSGLEERNRGDHVILRLAGKDYYVNLEDGRAYTDGDVATDALIYSGSPAGFLVMRATVLDIGGERLLESENPVSLVFTGGDTQKISYSSSDGTALALRLASKPRRILVNDVRSETWRYDKERGLLLTLPAGEGVIEVNR